MAEERTSGISRRNLLKGAVAAGGVVWAAPSILTQVASAQTACPGPGSCPNTFMVKIDPSGDNYTNSSPCESLHDNPQGTGGNFCTGSPTIGTIQPFNCAQRTNFFTISGNVNSATVTLTPQSGCRFIQATSKRGSPTQSGGACFPATISADCKTATFPSSSHLEFSFCCP